MYPQTLVRRPVNIVIFAVAASILQITVIKVKGLNVDVFEIALPLALLAYGALVVVHREWASVPNDRQIIVLLLFVFWTLVTGFWAKSGRLTLWYSAGVMRFVLLYLLILLLTRSWQDLESWVWLFPWFVVLVIGYIVVHSFGYEFTTLRGMLGKFEFLIGLFGVIAALSILPIVYVYLFSERTAVAGYCLFLLIACGVALLMASSRVALIVLVFNLTVFGWEIMKSRWIQGSLKRRFIKFVAISLVASLATVLIVVSTSDRSIKLFKTRMLGTLNPEYQLHERSFYWRDNKRLRLWSGALQMISSSPVGGVGFGNFREHILKYYPHWVEIRDAHDIYLGLTAETGLVGGALILLLLGSGFFNYRKAANRLRSLQREKEYILVKSLEFSFWGLLIYAATRPMVAEFPLYLFLALSVCCRKFSHARLGCDEPLHRK